MRRFLASALAVGSTAAVLLVSPAAQAAVQVDGYVWAYQPSSASYTAASGYERNSTGGAVAITRSSAGVYSVRFAGMAVGGGVAQVRPYGSGNTAICTLASWLAIGADEVLSVRCFTAAGVPADSYFVAHFTNRTAAYGTFAYFWAHDAYSATPYTPSTAYSYDSTGGSPLAWRQSQGVYMVQIPTVDAHYPADNDDGHYQITAYGTTAVRCEVHGENDETPTPIGVFCVDANGNPADTRFSVSYSRGVNVLGTTTTRGNAYFRHSWGDPASYYATGFWNTGGTPTVTYLAVGRYRVTFPGLSIPYGYAQSGSRGDPSTYCATAYWGSNAVTVNCYNNVTDTYADSDFTVAFTS
ncbi:hypothetical protein HDA40_006743 [Hamadaea flava]|uniref:Uncharacterized protein n=1 Tax=Hamadaea flava TaxID=1742688 RepID=A0ABV8LSH0_9ACTN|nr:hypothetical protein [Hamadaea flava]MCP2328236.1 hypothetical protein [Hamadaea flava]